ncbi:MAG: bifunctional methylenetetrahydrofolate dehydrogenase/methenyltetrahydrofolate cyclohydrolase FolD [Candidatus Amulumruptor caecigallinarius]|nr:bifunctional methylenetetrahydrofolate dehydrogenase/methenyltetrahydrofolate cyclohydrolase FolD [Candidatus Amulumruptor caecigallinarius]
MNNMDGKTLSEKIKSNLKTEIKTYMIKPCLAVIQVGNDEASNIYINSKEKSCSEVGIYFKHIKFDENAREIEIINKIIELNNDEYIHGILLQLPLPEKFNEEKLINYIARNKDVDGLTDVNIGKLINGKKSLTSCTPLGIIELLKEYNVEIEGKNVVIVGRSKLVGKPLISLFLNNNATVTVCHSKTNDLKSFTKNADILVVAVGQKGLITEDMVKENSVIIDVGINRVDGKLYGDVDYDKVKEKVSLITPVPGGVGPMTVAMLLENVNSVYKSMNSK